MNPDDQVPMLLGRAAIGAAAVSGVLVALALALAREDGPDVGFGMYEVLPFALGAAVLGAGLGLSGLVVALLRRRPVPSAVASGFVLSVVIGALGAGTVWLAEQLNAAW